MTSAPSPALLARFSLSDPECVTQTGIAEVWKARRGGDWVALKLYHDDGLANEAAGVDLMRAWAGRGAARIVDSAGAAVVMEWLEGPSLGDLTRAGQDREAAERLAAVAMTLRAAQVPPPAAAIPFAENIKALVGLDLGRLDDPTLARDLGAAQALAKEIQGEAAQEGLLHGDLHHDNVIAAPRGDCVIDPKAIIGPFAYEFANAFRNPKGAPDRIGSPDRARMMARVFAEASGIAESRLFRFAAMKAGWSCAWALRRGPVPAGWRPNLSLLLALACENSG